MFKVTKEEKVEKKLVTIEAELTYINGELQDQDQSITVADIALMLEESNEPSEEVVEDEVSTPQY